MSKQQLYINGKAVDMPTDAIKIKVESNILNDADKVMTAHSYNIALPRTITNDAIFALAYVAGADTGGNTTHCYLTASLYMDGVPLFEDGQAVLTSVDDKGYNINLFWGLVDVFDEIKREGLDLCDLPMSEHWDEATMATWVTLTKRYPSGVVDPDTHEDIPIYDGGMSQDIFNTLNSESQTLANTLPWEMPYVLAENSYDHNGILDKIAQVYGLTFDYSAQASLRIQGLVHPLTTRKAMCDDEMLTFEITSKYVQIPSENNRKYLTLGQPQHVSSSPIYEDACDFDTMENGMRTLIALRKVSVKSIRVVGSADKPWGASVYHANVSERWVNATLDPNDNLYKMDYTWREIAVEEGQKIMTIGQLSGDYWTSGETPNIDILTYIEIDDIGEVKVGDNWCYERNYPKMGVIDYISEVLAHIGGFIVGSVTKPNAIHIKTIDEVAQSTPQPITMLGLETITMSLDDLAQRNKYLHKENDDDEGLQPYLAEGVIYTSDETLKLEREAYKSGFKVPRSNLVRLWKVEPTDSAGVNKASWNNAGDYIASFSSDLLTLGLIFNDGQDFERTIARYYTTYEAMVNRPKKIDLITRLDVLDLMSFDMGRMVYVPQLGRNYMVVSIENDSAEQYKLELIQI